MEVTIYIDNNNAGNVLLANTFDGKWFYSHTDGNGHWGSVDLYERDTDYNYNFPEIARKLDEQFKIVGFYENDFNDFSDDWTKFDYTPREFINDTIIKVGTYEF